MRICKDCKVEKELEEFHRQGVSKVTGEMRYRWRCKKCHNLKFRPPTGKPRAGLFKKGHLPWNTGLVGDGNCRDCKTYFIWKSSVFKRDNNKCTHCFSSEKLIAHHIKTWNDFPELRFDVDNGLTLCTSCHCKIHGLAPLKGFIPKSAFKKGHIPWMKGRKMSVEHIKKLSDSHKGQTPWNKGKKLSVEHIKKLSDSHKGQISWKKGIKGGPAPSGGFKKGNIPWNKGLKKGDK